MTDPASLNIRHLLALPLVAQTGSISAAARAVNLTQPAITQGIANLERQVGTVLFDRAPGLLTPTEAGRLLAARAENAMRLLGTRRATSAQIRAFVAVARQGSYAGAADSTGLAEASLHRAVADLSVAMGVKLVERRGRGIMLTRRGMEIARNFRLAQAELQSGLNEVATLDGREVGQITVGAMPLSRARLLPNALASFYAQHPEVSFVVAEGSYVELVGPLRDGEIDMMLGALRDTPHAPDLIQTPLFDDRPVILARPGHPLRALGGRIGVEDLLAYPWAMAAAGTPLHSLWRHMFEGAGAKAPAVPIECGSVITIRQLLVQSDFLTLLSPDQVAVELEAEWLVEIGKALGAVQRTIGITTRADWRPTPLQKRFLSELEDEAGKVVAVRNTS